MLEYAIDQGFSALDAQAWRDKLDGFAVVSGLGVSVDSGLTVSIAAGTATVGETSGSVDTVSLGSSTTETLTSANPDNPRKDTIYIDTAGTIQVETGVAEAADPTGNVRFDTFQPEPPLPSTDGTVLAEVWVGAGDTTLEAADIRDRRVPADLVGDRVVSQSVNTDSASVTNDVSASSASVSGTGSFGAVETQTIGAGDYHYAGDYPGADPDVRLDNALADANASDRIYLEQALYSANRTISQQVHLAGVGQNNGTVIDAGATWTISTRSTISDFNTSGELVLDDSFCNVYRCGGFSSTITVNGDDCILSQILGASITFASGTSGNIIDSSASVPVTDNGTNTVGDIS